MSSSDLSEAAARAHADALAAGDHWYLDPDTGFVVMTELSHLERGDCCGNRCRHCPFDHRSW